MRRRREFSYNFEAEPEGRGRGAAGASRELYASRPMWDGYETALEALLSSAPHTQPVTAQDERLGLREVLVDALDTLPPRERYVFDRCVTERQSLRSIASDLSVTKSTVDRWKQEAVRLLRIQLENHPLVRAHFQSPRPHRERAERAAARVRKRRRVQRERGSAR